MNGDLIFVSLENWDDVWRRNQFVCAELAGKYPERKILFVGLPRNVSYGIRSGNVGELLRKGTYTVQGFPNITITHPLKLLPDSMERGREWNQRMFRRRVSEAANRLGMRRPVLWLNPHSAGHMVGRMNESAVVYDITDDWTSFKQSPRLMELVQRQDAELCERADAVIVCSERLYEMKRGVVPADRLHLIPNGVHTEHYRSVMDRGAVLPVMAREWKKPVMGYTGTVHGERVDVSLVRRLAAARGVGSVVLVGPNHLTPSEREALRLPNVFMPGAVAYRNIPDVMRAFDVCIVPHRMTAFTESLNPIKLWEYLAGGKPIVSTDVAGFRDYPKVVSVARTPEEFIAAALAAVGEGGSGQSEARRAEAEKHGWSKRVDLIEQVLEKCVGSRREGVYVG